MGFYLTAAGPFNTVHPSSAGPYTVASHARHVQVVWPLWGWQAACPTRTWLAPRRWALGQCVGASVTQPRSDATRSPTAGMGES